MLSTISHAGFAYRAYRGVDGFGERQGQPRTGTPTTGCPSQRGTAVCFGSVPSVMHALSAEVVLTMFVGVGTSFIESMGVLFTSAGVTFFVVSPELQYLDTITRYVRNDKCCYYLDENRDVEHAKEPLPCASVKSSLWTTREWFYFTKRFFIFSRHSLQRIRS